MVKWKVCLFLIASIIISLGQEERVNRILHQVPAKPRCHGLTRITPVTSAVGRRLDSGVTISGIGLRIDKVSLRMYLWMIALVVSDISLSPVSKFGQNGSQVVSS